MFRSCFFHMLVQFQWAGASAANTWTNITKLGKPLGVTYGRGVLRMLGKLIVLFVFSHPLSLGLHLFHLPQGRTTRMILIMLIHDCFTFSGRKAPVEHGLRERRPQLACARRGAHEGRVQDAQAEEIAQTASHSQLAGRQLY